MPVVAYSLIVGTPVSNCQPGSTKSTTSTSEGSFSLGDTWSTGISIGLGFGDLQIAGASVGWSQTKTSTVTQSIEIEVDPGYMVSSDKRGREDPAHFIDCVQGVLIARIQYNRTTGSIRVGDG